MNVCGSFMIIIKYVYRSSYRVFNLKPRGLIDQLSILLIAQHYS